MVYCGVLLNVPVLQESERSTGQEAMGKKRTGVGVVEDILKRGTEKGGWEPYCRFKYQDVEANRTQMFPLRASAALTVPPPLLRGMETAIKPHPGGSDVNTENNPTFPRVPRLY